MSIATSVLLTILIGLIGLTGSNHAVRSECALMSMTQQSNTSIGNPGQSTGSQIKVTIATGGTPYRAAKDTFRVGESVPLVITMTNTGSEPVYICESSSLYQNRPQLLKDGQPVAYTSFRQSMMKTAETNKTCQEINLPEQILLRPNEPTVVDWFNLAPGANSLYDDGWYAPLPAGKYSLTNSRQLSCCDGPSVQSEPINFAVVP